MPFPVGGSESPNIRFVGALVSVPKTASESVQPFFFCSSWCGVRVMRSDGDVYSELCVCRQVAVQVQRSPVQESAAQHRGLWARLSLVHRTQPSQDRTYAAVPYSFWIRNRIQSSHFRKLLLILVIFWIKFNSTSQRTGKYTISINSVKVMYSFIKAENVGVCWC